LANLIRNERLKLTANWLNAISTAVMAAGVLGPGAYVLLDLGTKKLDPIYTLRAVLICVVVSVALHAIGRAFLGELQDDE
jgi:hypothetical protein